MPDDNHAVEIFQHAPRRLAIRNLTPRLPERGKIKIGMKGAVRTSSRGNEFQPPMKLDHFIVTTLDRGPDGNFLRDQEFHRKFGDEPKEIGIRLLYDDIALNFPTRYACFIGKTLWCHGDGETAVRLSEDPPISPAALKDLRPSPREVTCTCHRQAPAYDRFDKCKMNGGLSVLIDGQSGVGGVWNFRTTGFHTITGLLSSLSFIWQQTGGILANIPLKLRLQPRQVTLPTGQTSTIYVVVVEFAGSIDELQDIGHKIALNRATTHYSIKNIEDEARRRYLSAPMNVALPGDNNGDVVEEFYSEQIPERPTSSDFSETQTEAPGEQQAPETPEPYEVINADGMVIDCETPNQAHFKLIECLTEAAALGKDRLDGVWEDNAELVKQLIAAFPDMKHLPVQEKYTELLQAFNKPPEPPTRPRGRPRKDPAAAPPAQAQTSPSEPPAWVTDEPPAPPLAQNGSEQQSTTTMEEPTEETISNDSLNEVDRVEEQSTAEQPSSAVDASAAPAIRNDELRVNYVEGRIQQAFVGARTLIDRMRAGQAPPAEYQRFREINAVFLKDAKDQLGNWAGPFFSLIDKSERGE